MHKFQIELGKCIEIEIQYFLFSISLFDNIIINCDHLLIQLVIL